MASWVNNMSLARGAHLVPGSTLMPKWEDRSGISIVQQNVNLLPKNKQQDPMLTKGPLFELAGKLETCNIHASLHTQLVNHNYFKSLYVFTTFEKVVDVVYEKVTYVEPWASRGDTTPSSAWIFLLKLFTLRLSEEQVTALLNHGDSPYLRAMGALYVRYGCEPAQLWRWLGPYADDLEEFAPSCDPNALMTFGGYCVKLLTDNAYYNTALPALPVAVQRAIKVSLVLHDEQVSRGKKNARWIGTAKLEPGATVRAIYDDYESDPKWFSAQIEAVVPPYDGAAEGTLPTYTVIFAQGSRDTIKLGQIDVQKAVKAEAAHPAEEPQRSKSRERRRRRDDSRSDDDDDRKHKSRRRRHRSRSRDRSRRDRGDGDGARDAEPQPARRPAPRDDGEVDDGEVQIFDARICKFKPVVEAPQDGALPVGESVLAGRDILGAVMRQERNNAVCEGKGVMRSRPVAFDTSLITPASAKVATYRKRSKSRDRLANVVAPLQRHLEDDRRADDRRADDRKAPRADSPPSDDDRRRRRDRKEDRKDDRRDDHRDDRREDRKDSRREDRGSRKDDRKDRRRRSRSRCKLYIEGLGYGRRAVTSISVDVARDVRDVEPFAPDEVYSVDRSEAMGAYLSAPVTAKESEDAECEWLRCGASSMQGWRRSMEDAHVNGATVGGDARFFGVFDGHGGAEVARFTARHIAEALPNDWNADASRALKALFHEMDSRLRLADNSAELTSLKNAAAGVARAPPRAAVDDAAVGTASDEDRQSAKKEAFALFSQVLATTKATQRDATDGEQGGAPRDGAAALAAANRAELANAGQESVAPGERRRCTLPDYAFSAGCAAVVVVAERTEGGLSRLWCANAGDSRAVVSRNGLAFGLSEDHKPNDSGERYRIDNAGGFVECANGFYRVNGNLNLSRSLGDLKYKQNAELRPEEQIISADPDVLAYDVNSDDEFFILACDGIWDVCSNQDAVDFVRKRLDELKAQGGHVKLSQICEDLFDFCLAKNPRETRGIGGDNMTVIIVEFNRV